MLLKQAINRNPAMVETAIRFHQNGTIPPATYLIDLDAIHKNAKAIAATCKRLSLRSYLMTKQIGRNPFVTSLALADGFDSTVAVETMEAHVLHRYGLPVGHVGHLSNIPKNSVDRIISMRPEIVTVFSEQSARWISEAAARQKIVQDVLVRINKPTDDLMRGLVGGWTEEECVEKVKSIMALPNIRFVGLTSFGNVSYASIDPATVKPNNVFETMIRAKGLLEEKLGIGPLRVNSPGFNMCCTLPALAQAGATDVEPGIGLSGSSLMHAYNDLQEIPAQIYVSEVMHHWQGEAYTLGGGLTYIRHAGGSNDYTTQCICGTSFENAKDNFLPLVATGAIDYHGVHAEGQRAKVGDTAIYALQAVMFATRAYLAIVKGISIGKPELVGLFDSSCNALDKNFDVIATKNVIENVASVVREYETQH